MTQSNEPTIAVINDVIGQFDEWEFLPGFASRLYKKNGITIADCDFQYHTSWDWLMPTWKRLIDMVAGRTEDGDYPADFSTTMDMYAYHCEQVDIAAAHNIVYQGIQWHNQQKQKDGK